MKYLAMICLVIPATFSAIRARFTRHSTHERTCLRQFGEGCDC